jgi:hypothetical protein
MKAIKIKSKKSKIKEFENIDISRKKKANKPNRKKEIDF